MDYRGLGFLAKLGFLVGCVLLCFSTLATAAGSLAAALPEQIILTWTDDPATTQTISWRSGRAPEEGLVQYLPAAEYGGSFATAQGVRGEKTPLYDGNFQFTAILRGLTPGTDYVYRVGGEGAWSEPAVFTAGDGGDSFSFLYMGDIQGDYPAWGKMLEEAVAENTDLKFVLLGGDLVDEGTNREEWQQFFAAAAPVSRRLPLFPAVGNHDDPEIIRNSFALPANGPPGYEETIYSFEYGNCHITVLDSNSMGLPGTGDYDKIASWLQGDLARSQKLWKLVVCHHPPYQAVPDWRGEHLQTNWVPLWEEGGVDLVFSGHQHVYMRTHPLRAGRIAPEGEGIVYILGNAGAKHYGLGSLEDYIAEAAAGVSNYQVIEVRGNTLTITAKAANGQVLDRYVLRKETAAHPTASLLQEPFPFIGLYPAGRLLPLTILAALLGGAG